MNNDAPRYFKDVLAAILFLDKTKIMFGFMNTFMYVTRYFMYHIKL